MARPVNIQNLIDSFLERIGTQVAKGVTEGIQSSGLLRQIKSAGTAAAKGKPGRKRGAGKTCSEKGCDLPARAKGLCTRHYQQKRYADLHGSTKPAKPGKRGRPPKAAKNVALKGKAPKRISPKKMAPKKIAPKKTKPAPVAEKPASAAETKE